MKIAFFISSFSYKYFTKVAVESFLLHNQDYKVYIFWIDNLSVLNLDKRVINLSYPWTSDANLHILRKKYNDFEFCNSLKPFAAEHLLSIEDNISCLIYLDSDLYFFSNLKISEIALKKYDIILTPHFYSPLPIDSLKSNESIILNTGLYNAGFFMIKRTDNVLNFLKWWKQRTFNFCYVNFYQGMFVDQIWLNFVPLYFKNVLILRDLGYNMAYWNLHERFITDISNNIVNGEFRLVFFHFSGFNCYDSKSISKYQDRFNTENRKDLLQIFIDYSDKLLQNPISPPVVFKNEKQNFFSNQFKKLKIIVYFILKTYKAGS